MASSFAQLTVALRQRSPRWVDRCIAWTLASELPPMLWAKSLLALGLPTPQPPQPDPSASARVLFAPFNYAGQAEMWARGLNAHRPDAPDQLRTSAQSLAVSAGSFGFPATVTVPARVFVGSPQWRRQLSAALETYTHVVIESFGSLRGRGSGSVALSEIRELQRRGVQVALLCHGSDIRSPKVVSSRAGLPLESWGPRVGRLQRAADENRRVLDLFDGPVFVSTPDLLLFAPEATWLPLVVDTEPWLTAAQSAPARRPGEPLRVLHVPSNAAMKGSAAVDEVCNELAAQGSITYIRATSTPHEEMPALIAQADIVVDQLLVGSYGVAACEAMSAGKVVVGHVTEEVRAHVSASGSLPLPIFEARVDTLRSALLDLVASPQLLAELGDAGKKFVGNVHSGDRTFPVLNGFISSGS